MKTFNGLVQGTTITNIKDGDMQVMFYDYYGDGNRIMCFVSNGSIYPSNQFDPKDWYVLEDVISFNDDGNDLEDYILCEDRPTYAN